MTTPRRVFHSHLGLGVAGGCFLGRSDIRGGWKHFVRRLRWGLGQRVWNREEDIDEGSMSEMCGR